MIIILFYSSQLIIKFHGVLGYDATSTSNHIWRTPQTKSWTCLKTDMTPRAPLNAYDVFRVAPLTPYDGTVTLSAYDGLCQNTSESIWRSGSAGPSFQKVPRIDLTFCLPKLKKLENTSNRIWRSSEYLWMHMTKVRTAPLIPYDGPGPNSEQPTLSVRVKSP